MVFTPQKEEYRGYQITQFTHSATIHDRHMNFVANKDDVFQARSFIDKLINL